MEDFCDRIPGQHTGRLSLEHQAREAAEWQRKVDDLQKQLESANRIIQIKDETISLLEKRCNNLREELDELSDRVAVLHERIIEQNNAIRNAVKTPPAAGESPGISTDPAQAATEVRKENQDTITEWANATFGPADSNIRIAARANEEMAELLRALSADDDNPKAAEEIADVVIVLYRVASRLGYDLHELIDKKMEINRGREWKRDNTGHGYHVRDKSATTPATPSAAVGVDGPGAGDHKEWCDGAKEFCERQVESDTVPRSEYDRVVKLNHHLREAAVMAITEMVPTDSKPTNCHNPESEDTPPRGNDVPVADTVPPEIGKRYVCRNGEVTEAMDAGLRIQTYPFLASVNGVTRTWMRDGKHDESKSSEYDLISEYNDPEPAESPDDWVILRDPEHVARKCDECRCDRIKYDWSPCQGLIGVRIGDVPAWGFRCRRKDLPVVPHHVAVTCPKTANQ